MQLKVHDLGFYYKKHEWLFRHLNMHIEAGEVVGLFGPSGSGKTTLCRILAGYQKVQEGNVTLNGNSISEHGFHPVQMVFQHPEKAVNPRWRMGAILQEGGKLDEDILHSFKIDTSWFQRWPNELSGGELQRFCVARALLAPTRILIADEMTTMLDAITQAQIWQAVLENIKKRGISVLAVSHERSLLERVCDRIIDWNE